MKTNYNFLASMYTQFLLKHYEFNQVNETYELIEVNQETDTKELKATVDVNRFKILKKQITKYLTQQCSYYSNKEDCHFNNSQTVLDVYLGRMLWVVIEMIQRSKNTYDTESIIDNLFADRELVLDYCNMIERDCKVADDLFEMLSASVLLSEEQEETIRSLLNLPIEEE